MVLPCLQLHQLYRQDRLCKCFELASTCTHIHAIAEAVPNGLLGTGVTGGPVQTRPAIQVTTHSDYRLSSNLVAYVTFVCAAIEFIVVSRSRGCTSAIMTRDSGHTYHKQLIAVYAKSYKGSASNETHSSGLTKIDWTYAACKSLLLRSRKRTLLTQ